MREAAFAVATLSEELGWEGIDGPEPVNLIFMLAIPTDQAGSTHMQLLTTLTTALVDDDTREAVLAAQSAEQLMALLDGEGDGDKQPEKEDNLCLVLK
ncbi:Phosphoenolpyruvate-dependent sugar phosphotransferase system, EIIA 2 [Aeromonas veronii]|nr:Phosphoenolpyruvate-dependent sugar phosphotransferase system, EIIA 2 [Aeromonas veronii]